MPITSSPAILSTMASVQVNTLIAVSKKRCISAANSAGRMPAAICVEPRTSAYSIAISISAPPRCSASTDSHFSQKCGLRSHCARPIARMTGAENPSNPA